MRDAQHLHKFGPKFGGEFYVAVGNNIKGKSKVPVDVIEEVIRYLLYRVTFMLWYKSYYLAEAVYDYKQLVVLLTILRHRWEL